MTTTGMAAEASRSRILVAQRQRDDEQAVGPLRHGERPQVLVPLVDRLDVVDDEVELAVG